MNKVNDEMQVIAGKTGNFVSICIPAEFAAQLQIMPGTRLEVSNTGEKLVITPARPDMVQIMRIVSDMPEK